MRRLNTLLGVFVLTFSLNAQNITFFSGNKGISKGNDQFSGFQATFSFNQIESVTIEETELGTFSAITIEGAYIDGKAGAPGLPVFKKMIAVPVGATPYVMVKNHSTNEFSLDEYGFHTIFPVQPDIRKDQDPTTIPFIFDEDAYSLNNYNSDPVAEVEVLGTMRGVIVGMLVVRPVQYNPVANIVKVLNDIEVEVTFKNGDYKQTQDLFVNTFSPYFAKNYRELFNNGVHKDAYTEHPDLYNTPVRMLVIANRMFEATLQPWIEWKTQKGFYVDVNYTDVIGTTAAAIKTFCHAKYNQGISNGTAPSFIVIVGDTPQVPASQTGAQSAKATDLYYAKVNTGATWFPDMYYSRLSAQNTQQLANQIEKILYYEKYQFADPTYLDNVLLIAGADGTWNPRVGQPQINYATTYYYNAAHGYSTIHKYLTSPYTGAVADFNNVGFANYTAHCGEDVWAWNGSSGYSSSQINSQTNINKYYVAMGNCCLAADFGYGECFGETMMRAQKKGAVGYIGSSPSSYWGGDFHFTVGAYSGSINTVTNPTMANTTTGCYDFMFQDADFNTLCSHVYGGNIAVTYANSMGYETHVPPNYYWEAYNVLGDGSLMPYNGQATENVVSHMPIVPIGLPTYKINAVPGSYVAISKGGVLYGVGVVDASGEIDVVLDQPILSDGNVDIVVTRNQYKPYIAQVPAGALDLPYLILQSYSLTENADFGKTIGINFELKNVSNEPFTAYNAVLNVETESQYVSFPELPVFLGNIEAGTEYVSENELFVTIAENAPNNELIVLKLLISCEYDDEDYVYEAIVKFQTYAPTLDIYQIFIENKNGIRIKQFNPNENNHLNIMFYNAGHADLENVNIAISINSEYMNIDSNSTTFETLKSGSTAVARFLVTTVGNAPAGTPVNMVIRASSGAFTNNTVYVNTIGNATNYYMANGTLTTDYCNFYDSRGPNNPYSSNENLKLTFLPVSADKKLKVMFSSFNTEKDNDILKIYDGIGVSEDLLIATLTGSEIPQNFEATNNQGALTFAFKSNENIQLSGWEAIIYEMDNYYNVSFAISDDDNKPVTDALIVFDNYVFAKNQLSVPFVSCGDYDYSVSKEGYPTKTGTVNITDEDVQLIIDLTNLFNLDFEVNICNQPFEGALINIEDKSEITDINGFASFKLPNGNHEYTVTIDGCCNITNVVEIDDIDSKITVDIVGRSSVTFIATYNDQPVEGAIIEIDNQTKETDIYGEATFSLFSDIYEYTIMKDDYITVNETIEVGECEDVEMPITLSLVSIEKREFSDFYAYPNPFTDIIYVRGDLSLLKKIYVNNMLGQRIANIDLKGKTYFTTDNLPKGVYMITFEKYDNKSEMVKMIKK